MMYVFLTVIHGTPYPLSLSLLINTKHVLTSASALLILMHKTIQAVYCQYMFTPFIKRLRYVKFWHPCLKHWRYSKSIEWKTKGQVMALRINVLRYNRFVFHTWIAILLWKNWAHTPSASGSYGRLAGWQTKCKWKSKSLKFPIRRLNYLDFYYVYR